MRAIWIIARLTVAEAARRRILWVLLGLTLASVLLTTWGVERLVSLARDRRCTEERGRHRQHEAEHERDQDQHL